MLSASTSHRLTLEYVPACRGAIAFAAVPAAVLTDCLLALSLPG